MKVFGIDIITGSVRSRTRRPSYALVVMEDGEITAETQVSTFRLQRLLAAEEPDILAVDSLQEISADQQKLFGFIQSLPPATRLVQVTGGEKQESLARVAARFNIRFNRFDPFAEARTITMIASLGLGAEVIAFENTCDIVVSRHRSVGKGGWSQNRYIRKIHGAVQRRGREIEAVLRETGLSYEKKEIKAFGGSRRVHFHVCASRDMVPVKAFRGSDIQVTITAPRLDRIRFRPLHGKPRHLIVGIDPGTTIGIGAVDLDGNLIHLTSSRQMSMSDVIEELYQIGKPLVIASDVRQMPYSVEKIRRAFNAVPYTPRHDRTQDEKVEATALFTPANDHERDALFAALEAYRFYKNKFANIAKRVPTGFDLDEVRAGVVRGMSIEQVLDELSRPAAPPPEEKAEEEQFTPAPRDERLLQLDGTVKKLRGFIEELQAELAEKEQEIERLRRTISRERTDRDRGIRKDSEVAKRESQISSLKKRLRAEEKKNRKLINRIERLRRFSDLQMSAAHIPFKVLESLTRDGVRSLDDDLGIGEGDVLYTPRTAGWGMSVVEYLSSEGIRALIVGTGGNDNLDPRLEEAFYACRIPLLSTRVVPVQVRGKIGSVSREDLERAIAAWEKARHSQELSQKTEMLESIIREYRSEREREVRDRG